MNVLDYLVIHAFIEGVSTYQSFNLSLILCIRALHLKMAVFLGGKLQSRYFNPGIESFGDAGEGVRELLVITLRLKIDCTLSLWLVD